MTAVDEGTAAPGSPDRWTASELMVRSRLQVPAAPPDHLDRPRLSGLLGSSTTPLVLLSAPAGSGKTTLALEWARRLDGTRGVVWVSCHRGHVDPWADVVQGMGGAHASGPAGPRVRGERVEQVLEAVGRARRPWTVILDGYDLREVEAAEEMELLLTYAGADLQVVLTTRVDPLLPLHRYRLEGRLLDVRAADLAFTDDEAGELLRAGGVELAADDLHALNERLSGWAAGLRFALPALAGRRSPRSLVTSAVTYNGNINAYLVEEVLDAQPPALRDLIMTLSVPDTLTPGLVEELTGEPAAPTSLRLIRANVFLEGTPGDESSLRHVPFFRDLVRAQLAYEDPERFRRLNRSVAAWYAGEGQWDRAVEHLAEAGDRPDCAALLVDHLLVGRVLCERPDGSFRRLVSRAPAPTSGPDGRLLAAAVALVDGDHPGCDDHLAALRRTPALSRRARVTAAVLEAVLAAAAGDPGRTEELAARAGALLAAERRHGGAQVDDVQAALWLARAQAALRLGAVQRAERLLENCLDSPTATWSTPYRSRCLAHAALLHARRGDATRAAADADEALAAAQLGVPMTSVMTSAHLARAYVALTVGCEDEARAHLEEASPHPEPLWRVVAVVVGTVLDGAEGAVEEVADPAGPWTREWLRQLGNGRHHAAGEPRVLRPVVDPPQRVVPLTTGSGGQVVEPLTPRELEVLGAMSEWLTTEEIAEKLFVSVNTVRTHVRNILTKLGVGRRNAAIREAKRLGLLPSETG